MMPGSLLPLLVIAQLFATAPKTDHCLSLVKASEERIEEQRDLMHISSVKQRPSYGVLLSRVGSPDKVFELRFGEERSYVVRISFDEAEVQFARFAAKFVNSAPNSYTPLIRMLPKNEVSGFLERMAQWPPGSSVRYEASVALDRLAKGEYVAVTAQRYFSGQTGFDHMLGRSVASIDQAREIEPSVLSQLGNLLRLQEALAMNDFHLGNWLIDKNLIMVIDMFRRTKEFDDGLPMAAGPSPLEAVRGPKRELYDFVFAQATPATVEYLASMDASRIKDIAKGTGMRPTAKQIRGILSRIKLGLER